MAIAIPTAFPLYRAGLAEVVAELDPIHADPDALDLLRAVTYAYAVPARPLLCALEAGNSAGSGLVSQAASGGARELVAKGAGRLSPSASEVRIRCELTEGDIEVQLWDEARAVSIGTYSTTTTTLAVVTGTITATGRGGEIVRVEVYLRRRAGTNAELAHLAVQETPLVAGDLPA